MDRRNFIKLVPGALASLGFTRAADAKNIWQFLTCKKDSKKMLYNKPPLILKADRIIDVLGETTLNDLPNPEPKHPARLKNATPIIERMWRIALRDVESNIVETEQGRYFGAGAIFGPKVFTRDISYSGILGVNKLYPDLMRSSLEFTRNLRWDIGFIVYRGHDVNEIDVDWDIRYKDHVEMMEKHNTNCYARRTDDVVWLWCAGDLIRDSKNPDDYKWLYEWGAKFFKRFYDPFFDSSDGLYRGQATFMDVHSPVHKTTAYPHEWSAADCVMAKATSTNCLYVKGLDTMAWAAKKLGKNDEAKQWAKRAESLRKAMLKELRNPDGTFAYYKDRWGKLAPRREALGTAFTVLTEVVKGKDAKKALAGYPVTDAGIPSFDPFFEFKDAYHNNTSWPFVNEFFLAALGKANNTDTIAQSFAHLARVCKKDGFKEYIDMRNKVASGSGSQLWSAAAFIDICFRAGLVKM